MIPPILQCLIYGYVATYDLNDVPYAVFDQDRSAASQKLLAALDGSGVFHRVANLERAADMRRTIDERRALLVLQIDQDFERRLMSGQPADLQVIADGRNSNTAGTAIGYIGTIIESFNTAWRNERRPTGRAGSADDARMVQSQPGNALAYDSGFDRHAHVRPNSDADRFVGGARARAGYFRPVAGDAFPAR